MRLIFGTVVALLALAGCSPATTSGLATASTPTPTLTSTPTAATTTTTTAPLSKADAARRYLDIVAPYNVALERLEQAINSAQPVASLRTCARDLAAANKTQIAQLRATTWPVKVRAPMHELIAESGKAQPFLLQAAHAQTTDQVIQAVLDAMEHDGTAAATTIRELLELDKYDETDYGAN